MLTIGPLGFAAPWLLAALGALPLLWWLLRALPPAPRDVVFPGTALMAGLADPSALARRTPWWLLALRMLALAAVIAAMAGPVWRPDPRPAGVGPLLVVVDAGWAAAPDWAGVQARARAAIDRAEGAGRPVALWLADGQDGRGAVRFGTAAEAEARLRAALPQPWATRHPDPVAALADAPAAFDTLWLSDGLDHPRRADWLAALSARGAVTVVPPARAVRSLALTGDDQPALVLRQAGGAGTGLPAVLAIGPDPQGVQRQLARLAPPPAATATDGVLSATLPLDLPPELRNRITRLAIEGEASAGAVVLADDRVRRHKVALVGDARATEGQALLSPLHYLRQALTGRADVVEGGLADVLPAAPDVVILADALPDAEGAALARWVADGGLLVRFAGPRMAASDELEGDPLLPVRLRPGGRDAGGALAWGTPRALAPFDAQGPFAGLAVPTDVTVRAQLLPEPDPDLAGRILSALTDGTPLVTRGPLGQGSIVLFHTTANTDWSNLPLSGLFVQMLDRLVQSARVTAVTPATPSTDAPHWTPQAVLDGFGRPADAGGLAPVAAAAFAAGPAPGAPAGIYAAGERRAALNAGGALVPALGAADWPGAALESAARAPGLALGGWLLALAALALALDTLGSAWLAGGRRTGARAGAGA
ncbi:BatA domain-containing protein [Paracoccus endophyticus]|uniref:BatA domain-containing protein n=1 Tax=Paracoccus endophyticus TaxID=2233774 RepID=UPI0030B84248